MKATSRGSFCIPRSSLLVPHLLLLLVFLLLPASPASAETLSYDNDTPYGSFQGLVAGNAEAMRLTTEHPAALREVLLRFSKVGQVEIHIWADNGGNEPDRYQDLIEPVVVDVPVSRQVILQLDPPLEVGPLRDFHVGHVLAEDDGPVLVVDTSQSPVARARLWQYSSSEGMNVWFSIGEDVGGQTVFRHYIVRAEVDYHDQITAKSFVDVSSETGYGSAVNIAAVDYDQDGDIDVLQDGVRLLRNDGGSFTDVSAAAGISGFESVAGGTFCDFDRDGDLDLFLFVRTCCNEAEAAGVHDVLLRNDGGIFTDVTAAAGTFDWWPNLSAAWGDYDGDGYPDLFLPGYQVPGQSGVPTGNTLFRNNGDGTFTDTTVEAGIAEHPFQVSRTVAWADYDRDGRLDLYVGAYRLQPNYLFHNLGGMFEEVGEATGTRGVLRMGAYGHTIGATWGDLDQDTDLDLLVMNLAHPRYLRYSDVSKVYLNPLGTGTEVFADVREQAGIEYVETAFEAAVGDYDNDGDLDLFQTNTYADFASRFYRNRIVEDGSLHFEEVSYPAGARVFDAQGAVWADIDGDGDLDLLTRQLFRNDGAAGNWLTIRLQGGEDQDTHGIGAAVSVEANGRVATQLVSAGTGEGSQVPFELHFGLGPADRYDAIRVRWMGGRIDNHPCGLANQRLVLVQGEILDPQGCGGEPVDPMDGGSEPGGPADGGDAGSTTDSDTVGDEKVVPGGEGDGCGCAALSRPPGPQSPPGEGNARLPILFLILVATWVRRTLRTSPP